MASTFPSDAWIITIIPMLYPTYRSLYNTSDDNIISNKYVLLCVEHLCVALVSIQNWWMTHFKMRLYDVLANDSKQYVKAVDVLQCVMKLIPPS
mmetsp:Transcript_42253/g.50679  ORF Transcript_42253/g.50679 Transcript_42253/m.50679 type:complete len:94 (+) Transcript_42253:327-608(+)